MAVLKSLTAGLFALAGMGAIAFAVTEVPRVAPIAAPSAPALALREFPKSAGTVAPQPPQPVDDDLAPMKRLEPKDAGTPIQVPAIAADVDAGAARVTTKDAGVAKPLAATDGGRPPAAVVVKVDAGVRPPPVGDALLNLRASDTADVYLDGRKIGGSPLTGYKVKAGAHKLRFDCYDEAGNAVTGTVKAITLVADEEREVTWDCEAAQ